MTIAITEKAESRETAKASGDWQYTITGTADQDAARAALYAEALGKCGTWEIDNYQVEPASIDSDDPDNCIWNGSVTFVPPERKVEDPLEVGDSSFSFDTGGGTQHITHIMNPAHHIATYPAAGAPDPKGGIGATADGVEGADIQVPVYHWSETYIVADGDVTQEYKDKLEELTATTNGAAFRGKAIGEAFFEGAAGSQRGDEDWEITFRFASSPNMTGIQIGDIEGISKGGWHYLWVRSERKVTNNVMMVQPVAVYVEQLYDPGDYGDLGIGE